MTSIDQRTADEILDSIAASLKQILPDKPDLNHDQVKIILMELMRDDATP